MEHYFAIGNVNHGKCLRVAINWQPSLDSRTHTHTNTNFLSYVRRNMNEDGNDRIDQRTMIKMMLVLVMMFVHFNIIEM